MIWIDTYIHVGTLERPSVKYIYRSSLAAVEGSAINLVLSEGHVHEHLKHKIL